MKRQNLAGLLFVIIVISSNAAAQSLHSAMDFLQHGNACLAMRDWETAISDYTRAIRINSHVPHGAMSSTHRAGEAEVAEIATSDDFNACAFSNRGLAHYQLGNLDKAIEDFNRAIRINPRLADAYNNRGNVWQAIGDLGKALRDFDQAIRLNPRHNRAFNNRANIRQANGELEEAIRDYNRSIELDSSNALAFANRGLTLLQLRRETEAIADFKRALELDPSLKTRLEAMIRLERQHNTNI